MWSPSVVRIPGLLSSRYKGHVFSICGVNLYGWLSQRSVLCQQWHVRRNVSPRRLLASLTLSFLVLTFHELGYIRQPSSDARRSISYPVSYAQRRRVNLSANVSVLATTCSQLCGSTASYSAVPYEICWDGRVARMCDIENSYKCWPKSLKGRYHLEDVRRLDDNI